MKPVKMIDGFGNIYDVIIGDDGSMIDASSETTFDRDGYQDRPYKSMAAREISKAVPYGSKMYKSDACKFSKGDLVSVYIGRCHSVCRVISSYQFTRLFYSVKCVDSLDIHIVYGDLTDGGKCLSDQDDCSATDFLPPFASAYDEDDDDYYDDDLGNSLKTHTPIHYQYGFKGENLDPALVAEIWGVNGVLLGQILKKVCRLGKAHKSQDQDLMDIISAATRQLEINKLLKGNVL